ncbi:MAG TPA: hypothetical protein VNT55_02505, partial [Baekduia sp.]|nr:hypothetical protein [Baekduia sp.]
MRLTGAVLALVVVAPGPASAAPITVSGAAIQQDTVVDRDGTLHVVYNERREDGGGYATHYCQVPRGGAACVQAHTFTPGENDFAGPKVMVTAFGDVLVLTHRCCATDANSVYVNDSGGEDGHWTGPRLIGRSATLSPDDPSGDPGALYDDLGQQVLTVTGFGVFFQAQPLAGGSPPATQVQLGTGDNPRDGSIVQTGAKAFMVAFVDGAGNVYERRFSCDACPAADTAAGIMSAASWTAPHVVTTVSEAEQTKLATGPSGTFLIYRTSAGGRHYEVRKWLGGDGWSDAATVSDVGQPHDRDFYEDAGGVLHLAYVDSRNRLVYRRSADGVSWSDPLAIASHEGQVDSFGQARLAARTGINGFAAAITWLDDPNTPDGYNRTLYATALPETLPTGDGGGGGGGGAAPAPGPSGPAPPAPCQTLSFGAIDAIASACFKRDGTAFVATGTVKVNGLGLVPDSAKVAVRFDPTKGTVKSTGPLRIEAGATLLWHGSLDWKVPKANRVDVADLDVGKFGGKLFGFPLAGTAKLRLVKGAASIPIHVGLPSVLGGVTGDVELRIDNVAGLHVHELTIAARTAALGPVEVRDLKVHFNPDDDIWDGAATLVLPPQPPGPSLAANFGMRQGAFDHAGATLTFPAPGIALGPVVYLNQIGFQVTTRPTKLAGDVTLSGGPQIAGVSAVKVLGGISFTFPDPPRPAILEAHGQGSIVNVPIADVAVEYRTSGFFKLAAHLGLDIGPFSANGSVSGFLDRTGDFNFAVDASVCLGDYCGPGANVVFSSTGFAGCVKVLGTPLGDITVGGGYRWGGSFDFDWSGCDVGAYTATSTIARRAAAGSTFRLPAGLPGAMVAVAGGDAAPSVTITGPGGRRVVTPAAGPLKTTDAVAFHSQNTTYVVIARPAAG